MMSGGAGGVSSGCESGNSANESASDDENSRSIVLGLRRLSSVAEMAEKGYFVDAEAWAPGEEMIPEPNEDKTVVFEDFFVAGLHMPSHPALADILLKFQMQLHQLTPNMIVQL
jgi:hypothetical protein